jgi:hypothetical protein
MRRVSLFFLCSFSAFSLLLPRVSVSSLFRLSLVIRARKVKFCEVLKTDLFFSFSNARSFFFFAQISSFLKFPVSCFFPVFPNSVRVRVGQVTSYIN